MANMWFRKTKDFGAVTGSDGGAYQSTAVSEDNPLPVQLIQNDENDIPPVKLEQDYLPPVAGDLREVIVEVHGIGTGSAYTAGDAFGTLITFHGVFRPEKNSGTIRKLVFIDKDDEGIQKDVAFFSRPITTTSDNSAFAPTDDDIMHSQGVVSITTFANWDANQIGAWDGSFSVKSSDVNLYVRLITQGADNIAAGSIPRLIIHVIPD